MDKCSGFEEDSKKTISKIVDKECFVGWEEFFWVWGGFSVESPSAMVLCRIPPLRLFPGAPGVGMTFVRVGDFFKNACNCAMSSYISGLMLCRMRLCACLGPTVIATWSVQASGRARSARLPSGLRDNLDTDYLLRHRRMFAALRRWIEIEITRWCNGNTRVFGTRIPGSSPGRVGVGF